MFSHPIARIKLGVLALMLALGATGLRASSVGTVTVVTEGSGVSYAEAVSEALTEAIGQRMGREVSSETDLKSVLASVSTDAGVDAVASQSIARRIQTATKGFVLGYEVRENKTSPQGLVTVKLEVLMADFQKSAQADRLRVAIARIRASEALRGYTVQLEAALKSALTESRKFAVLERDWEDEYAQETDLLKSDQVPREERARLGQRLGTDLLLVGTLVDFRVAPAGEPARLTEAAANGTFNFSLIDAATGQVKVAKAINAKLSRLQAKQAGGHADQILLKLAEAIGRQSADHVIEAAYPLTVVSFQGNEVVINQGGDRVKVGQVYDMFKLGESVTDPQTGESLGRAESLAGRIVIGRVTPKMSYAKIEEASEDFEPGMILRRMPAGAPNGSQKSPKNTEKDW